MQTTNQQSGWARLPQSLAHHYYPRPTGTVQTAFCGAASLRLIAPEHFTPREQLAESDLCSSCIALSRAACAVLTELAERAQRGEKLRRCYQVAVSVLLCFCMSSCREPQPVTAPARNLKPAATATPAPTPTYLIGEPL